MSSWTLPHDIAIALTSFAAPPAQFDALPATFRNQFEVFEAGPEQLILQHEDGGFLIGKLDQGRVTEWTSLEGGDAEEAEDHLLFTASHAVKQRTSSILQPGVPTDSALEGVFGQTRETRELARILGPDGGEVRTLQQLPRMAVLQLVTNPDGSLASMRWFEHEAAAQEVALVRTLEDGMSPLRDLGPYRARTVTEAFCHARFRGMKIRFARRVPESRRLEIWGLLGERPTQLQYGVDAWVGGWLAGPLGPGTSHLMDPVCWALWATQISEPVEGETEPDPLDLAMAIQAFKAALAFIPPGEELPPEGAIYDTAISAAIRKDRPELVSRTRLQAQVAALAKRF